MRVIDLSATIEQGMKIYPNDPEVQIEVVHTHEQNGWELRKLSLGSHTGTHVDSFSHMVSHGKSLDQLPISRFFGEAVIVDIHRQFPRQIGLFFIEHIGLELAERIIDAEPRFVGGNIDEALQRALLQAGIITYTDLINLEEIPIGKPFTFYGLPLKIKDGDGSPIRAIAIFD